MALPMIPLYEDPDEVLGEHVYSFTQTGVDPLAAVYAPRFDALVTEWLTVDASRVQLIINVARTIAKAHQIDGRCDDIVDMLVLALDKLTNKDKSDPLWFVYFQGENPSSFKNPVLKSQLEKMSVWPDSLLKSGEQDLLDVNTALAPVLVLAKAAASDLLKADQALLDFKKVGDWRKHIDKTNAERASIYGDLLTVPAQNPTAKLRSHYADLFFLHDTSRRGANKQKSSAQLMDELATLTARFKELEIAIEEAKTREAEEAKKLSDDEEKLKELAELKKQSKAAKAKQKELEKELKKKKK